MALFSIVRYKELEQRGRRIDSEYYRSDYLLIESKLRAIGAKKLQDYNVQIIHPKEIKRRYVENGILFLRAQNVRPLEINFDNLVYISEEDARLLQSNKVNKGDVLLTRTGANFGQCAIFLEDSEAVVSSHTFIIRSPCIDDCYLAVYLNTYYGRELLNKGVYGAAQPELSPYFIGQILVPSASRDFQTIICKVVLTSNSLFQNAVILYGQANDLLLSELGLLNWKPARTPTFVGSYRGVMQAQRIDAEYFHPKFKEMLDKVPQQIKFDRLGRLTTYKKGVEVGNSAYTDSGIPFWRVSNLSRHGLDDSNANFISQELYENLRQDYEPQQGEILLSKDATPGLAYYLEHPIQGIISSGILRLTITDTIPPHYLELVLNSFFVQMQIEQDAGGSIIKHWKPSEVRKTLIPRLSDDKEKEIAGLVQQSHAARREAKALLEKAKRAVEIAIEEGEDKAMEFIG